MYYLLGLAWKSIILFFVALGLMVTLWRFAV